MKIKRKSIPEIWFLFPEDEVEQPTPWEETVTDFVEALTQGFFLSATQSPTLGLELDNETAP